RELFRLATTACHHHAAQQKESTQPCTCKKEFHQRSEVLLPLELNCSWIQARWWKVLVNADTCMPFTTLPVLMMPVSHRFPFVSSRKQGPPLSPRMACAPRPLASCPRKANTPSPPTMMWMSMTLFVPK